VLKRQILVLQTLIAAPLSVPRSLVSPSERVYLCSQPPPWSFCVQYDLVGIYPPDQVEAWGKPTPSRHFIPRSTELQRRVPFREKRVLRDAMPPQCHDKGAGPSGSRQRNDSNSRSLYSPQDPRFSLLLISSSKCRLVHLPHPQRPAYSSLIPHLPTVDRAIFVPTPESIPPPNVSFRQNTPPGLPVYKHPLVRLYSCIYRRRTP